MAVETVKIIGLEGVLKTLSELPPEIVSKHGGPVRSALRKASLIMVNEMKANIQKIIDEPNVDGVDESTGLALKNIITSRRRMPSGLKGERYKVGPRLRKMYPKASAGAKPVSVVQNLRLLESGTELEAGTERRRPMPWARPAFDSKKHLVIPLFVSELKKQLGTIVKNLARKNGVS